MTTQMADLRPWEPLNDSFDRVGPPSVAAVARAGFAESRLTGRGLGETLAASLAAQHPLVRRSHQGLEVLAVLGNIAHPTEALGAGVPVSE
jgi:hypothetical protein